MSYFNQANFEDVTHKVTIRAPWHYLIKKGYKKIENRNINIKGSGGQGLRTLALHVSSAVYKNNEASKIYKYVKKFFDKDDLLKNKNQKQLIKHFENDIGKLYCVIQVKVVDVDEAVQIDPIFTGLFK